MGLPAGLGRRQDPHVGGVGRGGAGLTQQGEGLLPTGWRPGLAGICCALAMPVVCAAMC